MFLTPGIFTTGGIKKNNNNKQTFQRRIINEKHHKGVRSDYGPKQQTDSKVKQKTTLSSGAHGTRWDWAPGPEGMPAASSTMQDPTSRKLAVRESLSGGVEKTRSIYRLHATEIGQEVQTPELTVWLSTEAPDRADTCTSADSL